jgi:hypothetical protein
MTKDLPHLFLTTIYSLCFSWGVCLEQSKQPWVHLGQYLQRPFEFKQCFKIWSSWRVEVFGHCLIYLYFSYLSHTLEPFIIILWENIIKKKNPKHIALWVQNTFK